jgi:hypothetical protein
MPGMTHVFGAEDISSGLVVLFAASAVLLFFSYLSIRSGKTIRGRVPLGGSPYATREEDPVGFWSTVCSLLAAGLFAGGFAVWLLIYHSR